MKAYIFLSILVYRNLTMISLLSNLAQTMIETLFLDMSISLYFSLESLTYLNLTKKNLCQSLHSNILASTMLNP